MVELKISSDANINILHVYAFFPNVYFLADQKHHHAYLYFPKTRFPNSQAAHPETMEVQKLDAAEVRRQGGNRALLKLVKTCPGR